MLPFCVIDFDFPLSCSIVLLGLNAFGHPTLRLDVKVHLSSVKVVTTDVGVSGISDQ